MKIKDDKEKRSVFPKNFRLIIFAELSSIFHDKFRIPQPNILKINTVKTEYFSVWYSAQFPKINRIIFSKIFSLIFQIFTQKLFGIKFRNQQGRDQKNIQICKIFDLITLLKYYGQRFCSFARERTIITNFLARTTLQI